jgi:hypothetical protein
MANLPHEYKGHDTRRFTGNLEKVEFEKHLYVDVEYELAIWSYSSSEMNDLTRELMFSDIYNPVIFVVIGDNEYSFDIELGDPKHSWEAEDKSKTEKRYSLEMNITVLSAFWLKTSKEYLIHKINAKGYEKMTSGEPIELCDFQIIKTP